MTQARVLEERTIGTVKATVVELLGGKVFAIALVDTFGVHGSANASKRPCEHAIAAAVQRHVHISQSRTGRN